MPKIAKNCHSLLNFANLTKLYIKFPFFSVKKAKISKKIQKIKKKLLKNAKNFQKLPQLAQFCFKLQIFTNLFLPYLKFILFLPKMAKHR